jgi:hypothetical protein
VLALAGGAAGVALARLSIAAIVRAEVPLVPRIDAVRFDAPVAAVAAVLVALVPLVLILLPVSSPGVDGLRGAGRDTVGHGRGISKALVAIELSLALALSSGGALLGLSLVRLFALDPGFTVDGIVAGPSVRLCGPLSRT